MCGLNNVRSKFIKTKDDITDIYHVFKAKVNQIQTVNSSASIFFCPLIPTRSSEINKKNIIFNNLVFDDMIPANSKVSTVHGFVGFLDSQGLLNQKYAKEHDQIHLNHAGACILGSHIKKSIFDSNKPYFNDVASSPWPQLT